MVSVNQEADEGVEKDDEDCAQRRSKEVDLRLRRMTLGHVGAPRANKVKEEKGSESHSSVDLGTWQMLERANNDFIGSTSGVEATEPEQGWYLAGSNAKSGPSHESGYGGEWNEVNDPAAPDQTNKGNDTTSDNTNGGRNDLWGNIGMFNLCLVDDMANQGRDNGNRLYSSSVSD